MANDFLRVAEKFTSLDGATSYTFPIDELEYAPSQGYREATAGVLGADYVHDFAGAAAWSKEPGSESVRFVIWGSSAADADSQFDTMASTLRKVGLGKLWVVTAAGVRRWCYAKLRGRPSYMVNVEQFWNMPTEATFARLSDWFAENPTTGSQALSASPTNFTITNPGNARARAVTYRIRSDGATGFTDPTLKNNTLNQQVATTRDAAGANSELRIVSDRFAVEYSNDDGATYADDFALVTLPATQVGMLELAPGDNSFTYSQASGTPNSTLEWSFYAAYE
jgi:hypothetical protein